MARLVVSPDFNPHEISWDGNDALRLLAEQYSDDSILCRDPFDILAELEEELGEPLCRQ